MHRFLFKRLVASLPVLFGVVTLVFLLIHFIPGDPVDIMLGESAANVDRIALRSKLGLDVSLWRQYLNFWKSLGKGTWGYSITFERPVLELILERFPASMALALSSLLLAALMSLFLGVLAAQRVGTWVDTFATSFALMGMSLPIFVIAPIGILVFSIDLRWLPVSGFSSWKHLVLPACCLGVSSSGLLTRMLRTSVLEALQEDFVRTAKAKGLGKCEILFTHTLRNALIPVITLMATMLGNILAGAVLVETLFDFPGIGKLFFQAFQSRDFPLVQGVVLWIACVYVCVNIVVDVLYSVVDPRIRLEV